MESIKKVVISALIVFGFIYFVTNKKLILEIKKILEYKVLKKFKVKYLFIILISLIIILYSILKIWDNINLFKTFKKRKVNSEISYEEEMKKVYKQNKAYTKIMSKNTNIENCKIPYIPDNFRYIEGEWNTGFVIEDEEQNQFVWIPCTNIENIENIPILEKQIFSDINNVSYFDCYEKDYENFLNSALENGGFYISRFEIGNENDVAVSKKDIKIWNNITYKKAKELSENMYLQINSKLINGYAYDTAVNFIYNEIDLDNIQKSTGITGNKAYKNIYDLVDDNYEWTDELKANQNIKRGSFFEKINSNEVTIFADRFVCDEAMSNLGFRTIIYK